MNIEQLIELGVDEEIAEKVMNSFEKETSVLKKENEKLKSKFDEYSAQLTELDKFKADNESLVKKFTEYKEKHRDDASKFKQEMSEFRRDVAVSYAVKSINGAVPHDTELLLSLLDKSKISVDEDGNLSGFDEQINTLIESKPFLFILDSQNDDSILEQDVEDYEESDVLSEQEDDEESDVLSEQEDEITGTTPEIDSLDYTEINEQSVFSIGRRLAMKTNERNGN